MTIQRREFLQLAAGLSVLPIGLGSASAQDYPNRPITIIAPYGAGSPTDLVSRIIVEKMRGPLGQSLVVENVSGAGGSLGAIRGARAAPDGYTLCIGNNGSHVLSGALYPLGFDLINDLDPIARLTTNSQIIVTSKAVPATNLKELMAWLKDKKDGVSVGVAGPMAVVSVLSFQSMTGAQMRLVPYRGTVGPMQDLISGQIDLMVDQVSSSAPQLKAGNIRGYAIAAPTRSPAAPDIPTTDEAGLPGFYGSIWTGMWAPKGTPREAITKLNAVVKDALADTTVKQRLAEIGFEVVPVDQQNPQALATFQKAEIDKWWPIAKAANLKGD
jgi:tripartite-type tricarboxylate transporter receptor subunit TctC